MKAPSRNAPRVWLAAILAVAATTRLLLAAEGSAANAATVAVALGDEAWAQRAQGQLAGRAAAPPIEAAIAAYSQVPASDPAALEATWKRMRALWFQGEYVAATKAQRQAIFERGKAAGETALASLFERHRLSGKLGNSPAGDLAKELRSDADAAPLLFWSAVHWGLWGDSFGRLAAARQGVATKIRERCELVLAIDETYENGGGHRVLGRLHALAPRVPFFTGWIDRQTAILELRRAVALAPEDPLNALYLAEALVEHEPAALGEARQLLQTVAEHDVPAAQETEWSHSKAAARTRLAALAEEKR